MGAEYVIYLSDTTGTRRAILTDFLELAYTRRVNAPGIVGWKINGAHPILSSLGDKWLVEPYRRASEGAPWVRQLTAQHRDEDWQATPTGRVFEGVALDVKELLARRIVNYPAGVANRSQFTANPAETIMKALVRLNAGSMATVATYGRKRDATNLGIGTAAESARGNAVDFYCHGDNLLETLQELSRIGGGDFDLYRVGTTGISYTFDFYPGQLGTDRTAEVLFALERGNMGDPRYTVERSGEVTVAAVWGQGDEADRDYVTRTGDNYSASNDIEGYVDAKNIAKGDTAALEDRGDVELDKAKARKRFTFTPLQTPSTTYGEHYDLGDLVKAINPYTLEELTYKVQAITVSLKARAAESIKVELAEL